MNSIPVIEWSTQDVVMWLQANDLHYAVEIFSQNEVDGKDLLEMTANVLENDFHMNSWRKRSRILTAITSLASSTTFANEQPQKKARQEIREPQQKRLRKSTSNVPQTSKASQT